MRSHICGKSTLAKSAALVIGVFIILVSLLGTFRGQASGEIISGHVPENDDSIDDSAKKDRMGLGGRVSHRAQRAPSKSAPFQFELGISPGYRIDELSWNIAGNINGADPNVLSELKWEDLRAYVIRGRGKAILGKTSVGGLYIRADVDYGWITHGSNQDSDYLGENRTEEFSRSNNSSNGGTFQDASLGVGYRFCFGNDFFSLAPLVGRSYNRQRLEATDANQTIAVPPYSTQPLGPFAGLNTDYVATWEGPWVGVEMGFQTIASRRRPRPITVDLIFGAEYHFPSYSATANWNLADRFAHPESFKHTADGVGTVFSLELRCMAPNGWGGGLSGSYRDWVADKNGVDRVFGAAGGTSVTKLNEVRWKSSSVSADITYDF